MAVYYILLFVSALIFSSQFVVTKAYQKRAGDTLESSLVLSFFAYLAITVFFFVKGCLVHGEFTFAFSWFSFAMGLGIAVVAFLCVFMGIKVLKVGDMALYSMFMMIGSIVIPSSVGLIFYHESLTWLKAVALVMMISAAVLSLNGVDKSKLSLKALLYYIGIFVMNGMIGVFFTIHQNNPELTAGYLGNGAVDNDIFMTWYGIGTVLMSGIALLVLYGSRAASKRERLSDLPKTALPAMLCTVVALPAVYGLCNGLGDYFIALGTQPGALGSSVTFPIVDGGTILFSSLFGIFFMKEKCTVKTAISLAVVILSTVLFMFV